MHSLSMATNICNSLVRDRRTGAAIVKIKLKKRMKGKVSDAEGCFTMADKRPGEGVL